MIKEAKELGGIPNLRSSFTAVAAVHTRAQQETIRTKRIELEIDIVPQALSVVVGNGIGLCIPVESAPTAPPLSGQQEETPLTQPVSADHRGEKQVKWVAEK